MTANEIFKEILKDPILVEKYKLDSEKITELKLHDAKTEFEIIEVVKLIVLQGTEYNTPESAINSQIKKLFSL